MHAEHAMPRKAQEVPTDQPSVGHHHADVRIERLEELNTQPFGLQQGEAELQGGAFHRGWPASEAATLRPIRLRHAHDDGVAVARQLLKTRDREGRCPKEDDAH